MPDIVTRLFSFVCCLTLSTLSVGQDADTAQVLFSDNHKSIFQIRVMDNAANNKASTGTGFILVQDGNGSASLPFSDDGFGQDDPTDLIATNYHVIASAIDAPINW